MWRYNDGVLVVINVIFKKGSPHSTQLIPSSPLQEGNQTFTNTFDDNQSELLAVLFSFFAQLYVFYI